MSNIEKTEYIFGEYDEYVGFSRKNKEWNTFTHFVRFLKSSKNKNNIELQQALSYLDLLLDEEPTKIKYTDDATVKHNEFIYYSLSALIHRHSVFYNYTDYSTMKDFYYAFSILKYILKNVSVNNISHADFLMLSNLIKDFLSTNEDGLFNDEIKYLKKDKIYIQLQNKYSQNKS